MDTERAFIGFNTNGKEILVYKKDDDTYINLLSKDNSVYPTDDIEALIPYSKAMRTFKYKTRKGIVRKYVLDRNKTFNKSKIKIGYICSITNLNVYIDKYLENIIIDAIIDNNKEIKAKTFIFFV